MISFCKKISPPKCERMQQVSCVFIYNPGVMFARCKLLRVNRFELLFSHSTTPSFTRVHSCNPPQNPHSVGAALFHKEREGRSQVRSFAQGQTHKVTGPTFQFRSVEFFPLQSIGQTAGTLDLTFLIQPMVNSEICFYIKNKKRY